MRRTLSRLALDDDADDDFAVVLGSNGVVVASVVVADDVCDSSRCFMALAVDRVTRSDGGGGSSVSSLSASTISTSM